MKSSLNNKTFSDNSKQKRFKCDYNECNISYKTKNYLKKTL